MATKFEITPSPHIPSRLNASRRVAGGRILWTLPSAYLPKKPDCGELLRQSIIERDAFDADLRIIGYGLALAYLFVVVFQIARVL